MRNGFRYSGTRFLSILIRFLLKDDFPLTLIDETWFKNLFLSTSKHKYYSLFRNWLHLFVERGLYQRLMCCTKPDSYWLL